MSITRLRQARQMYAMGQRVGRIAFGGGGTQGDGGYQGGGRDDKGSVSGSAPGAGSSHSSNTPSGADDRSSDTQQYNHYEAISQNTGVDNNPLRPSGIGPGFIKPGDIDGLTLSPYEQQRVDFLDTPYKQFNIPPFVPGGMLLNTVGNFIGGIGADKNRQFFADNVAGKYGFGYGMDAYKDYMRQRSAGEVGAYGNENMGQNAIDERSGGNDGIMDVYNNQDYGDEDGDGDVDQDDFVFKYFDKTGETLQAGAGGVQDLMSSIRERISNLFS